MHRYVIVRQGAPVATSADLEGVVAYLCGRDIRGGFEVWDLHRRVQGGPCVVDDADLSAWVKPLEAAARRG